MSESETRCANCGETCVTDEDWTEEDKLAEMETSWGQIPEDDRVTVCDDCYQKIMADCTGGRSQS